MKLEAANMSSYHDEFDIYFARAKLDENLAAEQDAMNQIVDRRSSMQIAGQRTTTFIEVPAHHRRAVSCKLPSNRRRSKSKGSKSPKNGTPPSDSCAGLENDESDITQSLLNGSDGDDRHISMNYVTEATLRAPSPRLDSITGKSHSAPHSRSSSWKNKSRTASVRTSVKRAPDSSPTKDRSREGSLHFEDEVTQKLEQLRQLQADDVCIVRNFEMSPKGKLINRGDSFKRKPYSSSALSSLPKEEPIAEDFTTTRMGSSSTTQGAGRSSVGTAALIIDASENDEKCVKMHMSKVLVIGDHGVGKTALLQQFMTSDYMAAMETTFDAEFQKSITVTVDGEETTLEFVDLPYDSDMKHLPDADGFLFVYSITSRQSFVYIQDIIQRLGRHRHEAAIVVANKSDLVRQRAVQENHVRVFCVKHNCKYIEVSAAINHKVDELLVGLVTQVRLNPRRLEETSRQISEDSEKTVRCSSARGLVQMFFRKKKTASKSCENLLTL